MSMTREEAVEFLSQYIDNECYTEKCQEAHKIAISALRSVSREQVEKVWAGCDLCGSCSLCLWNETKKCNECENRALFKPNSRFCSRCGTPMTDEAVDIIMRRLEALHSETKTD